MATAAVLSVFLSGRGMMRATRALRGLTATSDMWLHSLRSELNFLVLSLLCCRQTGWSNYLFLLINGSRKMKKKGKKNHM